MKKGATLILLVLFFGFVSYLPVAGEEKTHPYGQYHYQNINHLAVFQNQLAETYFENFGKVQFVPIWDKTAKKIVIFLTDNNGKIIYSTDKLEINNLQKSDAAIAAVSFHDVNGNGLKDIILISRYWAESGDYTGASYKVGDVLFQSNDGFYSDSRTSEFINRFSMNQNIETIIEFASGKKSKEFLYTSKTLAELTSKGFKIIPKHSFWADFEAFGRVRVVSGSYEMGGLRTLMLYIIDSAGNICARIDSMKGYDDCTDLWGIAFEDIDGDGLKDIIVLAQYLHSAETDFPPEISPFKTDFYIVFQKDYWFDRNGKFEREFVLENPANLGEIITESRKYFQKL